MTTDPHARIEIKADVRPLKSREAFLEAFKAFRELARLDRDVALNRSQDQQAWLNRIAVFETTLGKAFTQQFTAWGASRDDVVASYDAITGSVEVALALFEELERRTTFDLRMDDLAQSGPVAAWPWWTSERNWTTIAEVIRDPSLAATTSRPRQDQPGISDLIGGEPQAITGGDQ